MARGGDGGVGCGRTAAGEEKKASEGDLGIIYISFKNSENSRMLHADTVRDHKRKHDDDDDDDDDDEGPPAGSNQGKSTKRRRIRESESAKKPSTTKESSKDKDAKVDSKTGKPILEEERPASPEPEWVIPPIDLPEADNNWANSFAKAHQYLDKNKLHNKIDDRGSFIRWYCRRIGKEELSKADLEGPAFISHREKVWRSSSEGLDQTYDRLQKLISQLEILGAYKEGLESVEARLDVYKKIEVNDKYKTGEGYHEVPPPYTGNFMPPKPNLVLADEEEYCDNHDLSRIWYDWIVGHVSVPLWLMVSWNCFGIAAAQLKSELNGAKIERSG
ncbi:hypothetical protein Tco_0653123 [Tanacetum coccineum]|uniref:Uncharacterized protein n=1 Tax=Tanacetum coccineum TaxID=301880 RepID=A0ABQ4WZK5_9ASTR